MAIFGFDIDDTVADGNTYFVERLNEHLNQNIVASEVRGRLNVNYNVDQSVLDDFFYNLGDKIFVDLKPIDGSIESINSLYDQGHTIYFITARPESANESTKLWLEKHGFKYHKLFHSETKIELCLELGVQLFVDDHPSIIDVIDQNNIQAVFVDCPKNWDTETNETVHRSKNWKDTYEFITKWEKINRRLEE